MPHQCRSTTYGQPESSDHHQNPERNAMDHTPSTSNPSREKVLARIREALTVPAKHRHSATNHAHPGEHGFQEWLPPVGPRLEDSLALFRELSAKLKTELFEPPTLDDARAHIAELVRGSENKRLATHRGELTDACIEGDLAGAELFRVDDGVNKNSLETCEFGVTECDALVAQTGSVLVTARSSGGRTLTVLPPHHIVLARRNQVVPDLSAAYERLRATHAADSLPSFIGFITGPSRTGDIERILVLGAHGPKRLTILLLP
jgi:L-lactate dehydrogenase complex protein LldG